MDKLSIINDRIKQEFCPNIVEQLIDSNLITIYKQCPSVKRAIYKLEQILEKNNVSFLVIEKIINEYILELVPAGTKGVIRGNKFNEIVKNFILNLPLSDKFIVKFENQHFKYITSEIPDWYIYDNYTDKIIIGMNQLDLWKGGQQMNRGTKYLFNTENNTPNSKLLCVICNNICIKTCNNKTYELFKTGFENDTLCYINNLKNIIYKFFDYNEN